MKFKNIIPLFVVMAVILSACADQAGYQARLEESRQQGEGVLTLVENQPVPDLGGWSFEREIVRQTYLARNKTISTYTYLMTLDGAIIEICASIGYPIPYSTQITNPEVSNGSYGPLPQAEPNGLYPPTNAEATLVQCVNSDGTVSPGYFEPRVFALPYRIASTVQLQRLDDQSSFSVDVGTK